MKFYQITDLHYYPSRELGACGEEWQQRAVYDQKCIAESEAIVDAAIDILIADDEIDIILISGVLYDDGYPDSNAILPRSIGVVKKKC